MLIVDTNHEMIRRFLEIQNDSGAVTSLSSELIYFHFFDVLSSMPSASPSLMKSGSVPAQE
jgi:hypothetical protein